MRHFTPRLGRLLLFAVLAIALFVNASTPGSATTTCTSPTVLLGSTFEGGDGNMAVTTTGCTDWATPAPNLQTGTDLNIGSLDNAFGQGAKEDTIAPITVSGSIPPNKNDLTRYFVGSEFTGGQNFLYLAWERLANSGSVDVDFELNQSTTASANHVTPIRTAGDVLVTYDFSGSGSTPVIQVAHWVTSATSGPCQAGGSAPCWGLLKMLDATNVKAAVNTVPVTDMLNNNAPLATGLFGEAAINLTAIKLFPANTCENLGSVFLKSRSSSSFSAEVKDFIAPKLVSVSNCGTIRIHENGANNVGYTTSTTTTTPLSPTFSLSDGGEVIYTNLLAGSYSMTQGPLSGWTLNNLSCTATGTGTSASTSVVTATSSITMALGGIVDCTYTNTKQKFELTLDKSAQEATYSKVGDVIHYSYVITNTGNVTLAGPFTVSDDKTAVSCPSTPASLAPSATLTCTATYTIKQADMDNGSVTNHATATNGTVTSNQDLVTVTTVRSPALSLTKTPSPLTYSAVGQTITYSYTVTNSGNVTLAGPFTISDDKLGTISCPTGSLAPLASVTCTATHTIAQTDLNTGSITNTATASTTFSSSTITSNQAQATVTAQQKSELTLDKSAQEATYSKVGDVIHYSYVITNTGNVTLAGPFTVSDDKTAVGCPSTPASLAPSATLTCTATYSILQADLDTGSVTNHATATNGTVTSNSDQVTVTATQTPALTLDKSAQEATYSKVGDVIHYSYVITNTGNVTLAGPFTVSDDKTAVSCPSTPASLAPSATLTCTATYTITQTNVLDGSVTNHATATGTDPNGQTVTSNQDQVTVTAYTNPTISTTQFITPNDTATISGATGNVGGTITFKLFSPSDATCSGTPAYEQTVDVSKGKTTNSTFIASTTGTWRWLVSYSGDSNNAGYISTCGVENFTITNGS